MRAIKIQMSLSLLLAVATICAPAHEYVTPGQSLQLTLEDLDDPSGNVVEAIPGGYEIDGRLIIARTDRLAIAPGTYVRVRQPSATASLSSALIVNGSVDAVGTAAQPIVFEASPSHVLSMPWMGVYHRPGSGPSHYRHCVFIGGGAGILFSQSSPDIRNCTFEGQSKAGIVGFGGAAPTIVNNFIRSSSQGIGILLTSCAAGGIIEDNLLQGGQVGIRLESPQGCTLRRNCIEGMAQVGVSIAGIGQVALTDQTISSCANGILASGTCSLALSQSSISDCTFTALLQMNGCSSRLRENWISDNSAGNLAWGEDSAAGIQLLDSASAELGTATSSGHNFIFGNHGRNLWNFTRKMIEAIGNHWDSADPSEVHQAIWDKADDLEDQDGSGFVSGPVHIEPVLDPAVVPTPTPTVPVSPTLTPTPTPGGVETPEPVRALKGWLLDGFGQVYVLPAPTPTY